MARSKLAVVCRRFNRLFVTGTVFLAVLPLASADVLVTNLSEPLRDATVIGNAPGAGEEWSTQSFFTDANSYTLDSIQIRAGSATSSPAPDAVFQLRRTTGGGEPDMAPSGLLTNFAIPSLSGANSVRTFIPLTGVTLDPNTQYWFVAGTNNDGTYQWEYADTGNFSGPGSLHDYGHSDNMGTTWYYPTNPYFPLFMQVNVSASAVPEPGMAVIVPLLGICGAAVLRRGRRQGTVWQKAADGSSSPYGSI